MKKTLHLICACYILLDHATINTYFTPEGYILSDSMYL